MAIKYEPKKLLQKVAPKKEIKKMVSSKMTLNKTALKFVDRTEVISKKSVTRVALNAVKEYKKRSKGDPELRADLKDDPKMLIQRVQNEVVMQISKGIKEQYHGEFYVWLPSDADEPDPEHQLNYGKTFQIGDGEMPGERYGCRCGMNILTSDTKLEL